MSALSSLSRMQLVDGEASDEQLFASAAAAAAAAAAQEMELEATGA